MGYKVIVVEDEAITRAEIAQTTPWEELGLELVGAAADGIAGEALIGEKMPDVVITDIRLPGQDGLTMLKNCEIRHAVIISGYSDFAYMKQALKLNAFDYLLKPLDDEELKSTLTDLVRTLDAMCPLQIGIVLPKISRNYVVQCAEHVITKRYGENIGLLEVAHEVGVSESHLSRLFKEITGWNFQHYLNAFRINKSIELLKDPKNSILYIAEAVGFSAAGYYTKIYRRFTGETPSQSRTRLMD